MEPWQDWRKEVGYLIERAEAERFGGDPERAVQLYEEALEHVPEPIEENAEATEILVALGEMAYLGGERERALDYFSDAVRSRGGLGLAHIHLRLGQLRYQRGEMDRARDELMRAYMAAGPEIFEGEEPGYYALIRDLVERPR